MENLGDDSKDVPASELVNGGEDHVCSIPRRDKDENGAREEDSGDAHEDSKANYACQEHPNGNGRSDGLYDDAIERSKGNNDGGNDSSKDESHEEHTDLEEEKEHNATEEASTSGDANADPAREICVSNQKVEDDKVEQSKSRNEENRLHEAIACDAPHKANDDRGDHDANVDVIHDG